MNLTRKLLVHIGGLLRVCGDQILRDGVLDLLLYKRRHGRREGARNVIGNIRAKQKTLDLIGKIL